MDALGIQEKQIKQKEIKKRKVKDPDEEEEND